MEQASANLRSAQVVDGCKQLFIQLHRNSVAKPNQSRDFYARERRTHDYTTVRHSLLDVCSRQTSARQSFRAAYIQIPSTTEHFGDEHDPNFPGYMKSTPSIRMTKVGQRRCWGCQSRTLPHVSAR